MDPMKAIKIFDKYLQQIDDNELKPNLQHFMHIWLCLVELENIEELKTMQLIRDHKFEVNASIITDLMRGYMVTKQYKKSLRI